MKRLFFLLALCASAVAQCGPPNYACTTQTTAVVNTPTAPFSSRQPTGTVNTSNGALGTCSANCAQQITGDAFQSGWQSGPGNGMYINGVSQRVDSWNPPYATLHNAPGTQTGVTYLNYQACVGTGSNGTGTGCLNSVGYDASLNPRGRNPIVRVSDGSSVGGGSPSSTASGGDSDMIWSCTGFPDGSSCQSASTYYLELYYGGTPFVEALQFQNVGGVSVPQVTGTPVALIPSGGLFFSMTDPTSAYEMQNITAGSQVGDPVLYKDTFSVSGGATGYSKTQVLDVGASCPLPGGIAFGGNYSSIAVGNYNSNVFTIDISNVKGVSGSPTASFTYNSTAFTMVSGTLPTGAYDLGAQIKINGSGSPRYFIATINGSGTAGTLSGPYLDNAGTNTYSVGIPVGQGTGIFQVVLQLSPAACSVLNTYTGVIASSGAWSSFNGNSIDTGCTGNHIHDSAMAMNGTWGDYSTALPDTNLAGSANCSTVSNFFQVGTGHGVNCTANSGNLCVGHDAWGYDYHVSISNPNLYFFLAPAASSATVNPFTTIPDPFVSTGSCQDHFSYRNSTSADTELVIGATGNNAGSSTIPEYNEVYAASPITGNVSRFGHTFECGPGAGVGCGSAGSCVGTMFTAQYAIGAVSRDGRMFAFTSDMLAGLGSSIGQSVAGDDFVYVLDGGATLATAFMGGILQ